MTKTKVRNQQKQDKSLVETHKKAANYHQEAAKQHFEAIALIESGKHEKAWKNLVKAHGQHTLAGEAQTEILKLHANYNNVLYHSHIKKYKE